MKKKVLYLMHVPWGWIKQRPHFIAEYLAEEHDVMVCYRKTYHSRSLISNSSDCSIKIEELFVLPFNKYKLVSLLNSWLVKMQYPKPVANYDIVWITHPDMYRAIRDELPESVYVVYDCMDDALEFPVVASHKSRRQRLSLLEHSLIKRSNLIIATSQYLKNKLMQRYNLKSEIFVINNAINLYKNTTVGCQTLSPELDYLFSANDTIKIVYIGSVSEWFDFDLLLNSLAMFSNISFVLIGPTEVTIPQHDRIIYHPPVEHKSIYKVMELADALVMPFKLNELVLSVNPIKLYEYISSGKPSIAVRYDETDLFEDYVNLYSTPDEFNEYIQQLILGHCLVKKNREQRQEFLQENSWQSRVQQIQDLLSHVY